MCMVFETLGDNLLALIKAYKYKGIPVDLVRKITRQVCFALDFLHRKCRLIHTDLKPENVLLARRPCLRCVGPPGGAGAEAAAEAAAVAAAARPAPPCALHGAEIGRAHV